MVHIGCLCNKKHSPLIVWAILCMIIHSTIFYTWRHPTISHTLSGFGRESPAGHPTKNGLSQAFLCFKMSAVLNPDYCVNCFAMCENLSCLNIPSWILLPKKDFTRSSAVSATILHSVVCCQPILCSTSRPCTVVWWQILTLRIFVYKYMINIPSVTLIPVWSGKCWKVKYLLRILCQVLPKCRPSRCQVFLAQEASSPQSAKRFYKNLWFFGPRNRIENRMEIWVKKSWQVCELLTSKISFGSATSKMFSSEMFHRCYTFFWCGWCGPKGGKAARWGCPFDFGCRREVVEVERVDVRWFDE